MAERPGSDGLVRFLVGVAAAVVVLAAMRAASAVLIPLLIALTVAVIVAPAQGWLGRRGLSPGWAFVALALGVTVLIGLLVWLTYSALSSFLHSLPTYGQPLDDLVAQVYDAAEGVGFHLRALVPPPKPDAMLPAIAEATRSILADVTSGWLLVLAITLFMLYEARTFRDKLAEALGRGSDQLRRVEAFGRQLGASMGVLTVTNVLVGIANAVVLLALGVPNALLWAALSFLLSYIPNVGFIISVIPPTVATLLHHGALPALGVLVAFIVINSAIDEVLYPRLVGATLDLAPFWTLMSLIFWGWLFGVAGAILAVPLTMLVKLVLDSFESTRPIGTLLTTGRRVRKAE